jgi:DEAD/DEAH box helicase domain-containing protein
MFPLLALCDRQDIGGISYPHHPQVKKSAIFFYDGYPGGIGLCDAGYERVEELLESTRKLLAECPCEEGCPSCVHSPKCGSGNKPLDKKGAQLTLEFLMGERPIPESKDQTDADTAETESQTAMTQVQPRKKRVQFMDIETQRGADEVGGWENKHLMKLAVGVVYDTLDDRYHTYFENQVDQMFERMFQADLVIGFNHVGFDYPVLQAYSVEDLAKKIRSFDMLEDIRKRLGFRLKLNDLAKHTLKVEKLADGLQSLEWFKAGEMDKIVEYCIQDVKVTKELFEYGCKNGHLIYTHRSGEKVRLPVDWSLDKLIGS